MKAAKALGVVAIEREANPGTIPVLPRAPKDWDSDPRTVTSNRLFTVDLPRAIKRYARGFDSEQRDMLRTDALLWIVERETVGSGGRIPIGPSGSLPLRTVWLTSPPDAHLTDDAWTVMYWAIQDARKAIIRRAESVSLEIPTEGIALGVAAENEQRETELEPGNAGWIEATAAELARAMNVSEDAARWIEASTQSWSAEDMADAWRVTRKSANRIFNRGRDYLAEKFPSELRDERGRIVPDIKRLFYAFRDASSALLEMREHAARESILEYRDAQYGWTETRAREDAARYLDSARTMHPERRALQAALARVVRGPGGASPHPEWVVRAADSIERLLAAERMRELENVRLGRRGILAGSFDSASDAPLYIGARQWRCSPEDSEIAANRERVRAARDASRFRYLVTLAAATNVGALLVLALLAEERRQRSYEAQRSLAIEQSLDASYSASFAPQLSMYSEQLLAAEQRERDATDARLSKCGRAVEDAERAELAREQRAEKVERERVARDVLLMPDGSARQYPRGFLKRAKVARTRA